MKKYYFLILFIVVSVFLIFNMVKKDNSSNLQENNKIETITNSSNKETTIPEGFLEYRNKRYNFYLFYPKNFSIREQFLVDKGIVIAFEDIKIEKGFQIFIIPYEETEITPERFKKDMPSGVRKDLENIYIGDVLGASFYGFDENLGETKEIWFINKGFLYEISTLKSMESLVEDLVKNWNFIG